MMICSPALCCNFSIANTASIASERILSVVRATARPDTHLRPGFRVHVRAMNSTEKQVHQCLCTGSFRFRQEVPSVQGKLAVLAWMPAHWQ